MGARVEVLSGIFWKRNGTDLMLSPDEGDAVVVFDALRPFEDTRVKISLHHWPETIQEGKWGGGCCLWQPAGRCPAGHHERPASLLNAGGQGVLRKVADGWVLEPDGGVPEPLPFHLLEGHRGRVIVVAVADLEDPGIPPEGLEGRDSELVGAMEGRLRDLHDMVGCLKDFLGSVKGG